MNGELVKRDDTLPDEVTSSDALKAVLTLARDPNVNMDTVERLLALHERMTAKEAEKSFIAAKSRIMAKLPVIKKTGEIMEKDKKTVRSKFVQYDELQKALDPLLIEEGFSIDFNSASTTGKLYELFCTLSHRDGHKDTKTLPLPIDASNFRTDVQNVASTLSFGKRQLTFMHFPIRQEGADDDGNGGEKPITAEEALDLEAMLQEVKGDKAGFLRYMGAASIPEILARDHKKAVESLQAKRRSMNK